MVVKAALGAYSPDCLSWRERDVPELKAGEVLVKTIFLSLDPTSRNWLKLDRSAQYLPIGIGDVMLGAAVGEVIASNSDRYAIGDLVSGMWGWEEYSNANPDFLERITPLPTEPLESYLSIFSHVGRAAVIGLLEVGKLRPTDLVVVSGAAGATGALACQISKAYGNHVIGIAGGAAKCEMLLKDLGVDHAIDYKDRDVERELARLCPDGVDLLFDNVGGPTLDAVLARMAIGCRIVVCGAMSQYNLPEGSSACGCKNLPQLLFRRGRIEGFVVPQFHDRYAEFDDILHRLYREGKLLNRAHIIEGLQNAPEALALLFDGRNRGKLMVKTA